MTSCEEISGGRTCARPQLRSGVWPIRVRELSNEEGNQQLWIIRRGSGSVVRWLRAQIILWSAQGVDVGQIAKIAFTSEDRVRAVIHNFNGDGFDSLAPKYAGGRPPTFTLPQRREIKRIALSHPQDHHLPFSTWSLSKLAEFLAEGWSTTSPTRACVQCLGTRASRVK